MRTPEATDEGATTTILRAEDPHIPNLRNNAVRRRALSTERRAHRHVGRTYPLTQPEKSTPQDPAVLGVCKRCGRFGLVTGTRLCAGWVNKEAKLNAWTVHSPQLVAKGFVPEKRSVKCIERGRRKSRKAMLRVKIKLNVKQFLAELEKDQAKLAELTEQGEHHG